MKKYNYFTWWLSTSIKDLGYRIWRYIMFPVIFILWVACIGAFRDLYWKLSLYVILPCVVIDLIWNLITYEIKGKSILLEEENKKDDKEN
jgi:hypothetical protein